MTDTLLEAGARATENPNFLRAVTDMAERCAVVTQDAIYSANGIKLVEKGARIDSTRGDGSNPREDSGSATHAGWNWRGI